MEKDSLERLKEITSVFAAYGFGYMVNSKGKRQSQDPENLRKAFEKLGSTFIKIGQILSTRPDLLPEEYIKELSKLQNAASCVNFTFMRQVFFDELNIDMKKCFREINHVPIATASIAQVYEAILFNGENVVIKIQKPGIDKMISMDLHILKKMASIMSIYNNFMLVDPIEALNEIEVQINNELDFDIERKNIKEFNRLNKDIPCIKTFHVIDGLCTKKVITMEKVDGFKINDISMIDKLGYDRKDIGKKLAISYCKQVFDDGFFHGDPHPGNVLISDGKICFIDFGLFGKLSESTKESLNDAMLGVATRDVDLLVGFLLSISIRKGRVNRNVLYNDLEYLLDMYAESSIKNIKISTLLGEIVEVAKRNNLQMPKEFVVLGKGAIIIEGVVADLSPDMNILDFVVPYVKSKYIDNMFKKLDKDEILIKLYKASKNLSEIPMELSGVIKTINHGRLKVNIESTEFKETMTEVNKMINRIVFGLVVVGMIIGSSLVLSSNVGPKIRNVSVMGLSGYAVSGIFGLYLIISIIRSGNLK